MYTIELNGAFLFFILIIAVIVSVLLFKYKKMENKLYEYEVRFGTFEEMELAHTPNFEELVDAYRDKHPIKEYILPFMKALLNYVYIRIKRSEIANTSISLYVKKILE